MRISTKIKTSLRIIFLNLIFPMMTLTVFVIMILNFFRINRVIIVMHAINWGRVEEVIEIINLNVEVLFSTLMKVVVVNNSAVLETSGLADLRFAEHRAHRPNGPSSFKFGTAKVGTASHVLGSDVLQSVWLYHGWLGIHIIHGALGGNCTSLLNLLLSLQVILQQQFLQIYWIIIQLVWFLKIWLKCLRLRVREVFHWMWNAWH